MAFTLAHSNLLVASCFKSIKYVPGALGVKALLSSGYWSTNAALTSSPTS